MKRWQRPRGMVGRIALVLVVALLLELAGNFAFDRWQDRALISADETRAIAQALAAADNAVSVAPPSSRPRIAHRLGAPGVTFNWVPHTVIPDVTASIDRLAEMRTALVRAAPALADRPIRLTVTPSDIASHRDLVGAMQLADGSFVTFRVAPWLSAPPSFAFVALAHLLMTGSVLAVALAMTRALIGPLRRLAEAADATGRGQPVVLAPEGPHEVRRVATAFAAMQMRLLGMIEDHSQALVAVSHDLRTPIQRLRLRAALLDDEEARDSIAADLAEMERFIDSTLAYVRDDAEEAPKLVDVAAIVTSAVDDAADAGAAIGYSGPDSLAVEIRPIALKRALGNLIDNAVRHAGRVKVSLEPTAQGFTLAVGDDGPGIPADRRADMLLPFRRMEASRGRASGGAGLGLTIVDRCAARLGGTLTLDDSRLGGLCAVLTVPAQRGEM